MLAGVFAGDSRHFGCEQVHDRSVFVRCPNSSFMPQKTGASAFFTAKAKRSIEKTRREPFESYRHLAQSPPEFAYYAINDAAADQRFAYGRLRLPLRPMCEQITNGH